MILHIFKRSFRLTYSQSVLVHSNLLDQVTTFDGYFVMSDQVLHNHISHTLTIRIPTHMITSSPISQI